MKTSLLTLFLFGLSLSTQAKSVTFDSYPYYSDYHGSLILPDSGPVTLADLPYGFGANLIELAAKIPELSLPPRGKDVDMSGVYFCTKYTQKGEFFSVHQNADKLLLVNISQDLAFLKDMRLLDDADMQTGVKPGIEEFAFWAVDLTQAVFSRIDDTVPFAYGEQPALYLVQVPSLPVLTTGRSGSITNTEDYRVTLRFIYFDGQPMRMDISADAGVLAWTPREACSRVF